MDAKDILGLPKTPLPLPQEKKSRPQKDSQRKPDGISREVYALTGGLAPLMPSIDVAQQKWRAQAENEKMWTKNETDQLFDLCEWFDLRFVVIADRFQSSRTVEELKDRYYSVSRTILIARVSSPDDVSGHSIVKEPYNVSLEIERKRALSMVLSQTKHQERKDTEVLAEAKRISESRIAARSAEERELPETSNAGAEGTERRAIVPADTASPSSSLQFASGNVEPPALMTENASATASLRMLRVYTRTYALEQMVQAASTSAGLRTIKRVEQTLQDLGVNLKPKVPTKAVCAEHLELRKEILTLLNLQKQRLQRGFDHDYAFPDPLSFGGDRVGKRDQKRKAPGRLSEAPSSPAQSHKRPRKLKASNG